MPRPRLTVRRMMLAVAIAAIALALYAVALRESSVAAGYRVRLAECERRAAMYSNNERSHREGAADCLSYGGVTMEEAATQYLVSADREGELARHYAALASKYRLAALFPWLPVAPDPPEPE